MVDETRGVSVGARDWRRDGSIEDFPELVLPPSGAFRNIAPQGTNGKVWKQTGNREFYLIENIGSEWSLDHKDVWRGPGHVEGPLVEINDGCHDEMTRGFDLAPQ